MTAHPWFLETDQETGTPIITVVDDMTLEKFSECLAVISDTPSYRSSEGCLWDMRSVSNFFPAMAIRYHAASLKRAARSPQRTAIVVGKDVHFGLARMFAICSDQLGITRRVFRDYEQARAWLLKTAPSTNQVPVQYVGACQGPAY
jgi:hypothetical protein